MRARAVLRPCCLHLARSNTINQTRNDPKSKNFVKSHVKTHSAINPPASDTCDLEVVLRFGALCNDQQGSSKNTHFMTLTQLNFQNKSSLRYYCGTVPVRYVRFQYGTVTVRYGSSTARLQYGTVTVRHGYSSVGYGYSAVKHGCSRDANNFRSKSAENVRHFES